MIRVYSVIVTFNGAKWIRKCLDSILNSTIQTKIIVIDNNSADETADLIEQNYSEVELFRSDKNLGFGRSNNIGLKKAYQDKADFVFLLNQDAWVEKDTIEILIDQLSKNTDFGILAPLNLSPNGHLEESFERELNQTNCPGLLSDLITSGKPGEIYSIKEYVNASCWMINYKCLATVGGFDPVFNHYGEDFDYCRRANFHKIKVGICTLTGDYHAKDNYRKEERSFRKEYNALKREYLNNFLFLKLKNLKLNFFPYYFYDSITLLLLFIKYLTKFSFKQAVMYLFLFIQVQSKALIIYRHRKKCKLQQPSFLI